MLNQHYPLDLLLYVKFAWVILTDPSNEAAREVMPGVATIWFIPAFFGRLWLIAYIISGLLLKCAKNIDFGFTWFNRRFDVENHPLQSIGLVAGTLTAFGYWSLATIHVLP